MTPNKRWRVKHPDIWQAGKKKYYDQFHPTINKCQLYTADEDALIITSELSDRDLHGCLGRSVAAIQNRRSKLRKRVGSHLLIMHKNLR
ncbi:MAG: hypothetical protein GOV02_03015 [Candidatus Aenigmarchaeota archaeon]|nr:hypothetical protein [Candidatus Aenigmarchaeota archaeon]